MSKRFMSYLFIYIQLFMLAVVPAGSWGQTAIAMGGSSSNQESSLSTPKPRQILKNLKMLQKDVIKLKTSGKNPIPVMNLMKQVPPLMKQGKFQEADKIIKEANIMLEKIKSGEEVKPARVAAGLYEKITIIGEASTRGVADPSVEYNKDGSVGWLAYSSIETPASESKSAFSHFIHTHLAKSTDHGKTWEFVARVNTSNVDSVVLKGKTVKGVWDNEVCSLVYDPDDEGREWKLFWHKYFSNPLSKSNEQKRIHEYSWIMYKYANTPEKLSSATEIKLFDTGSTEIKAKHNLNKMLKWSKPTTYSEIGSLYKDGVLYLSLSGFIMRDMKGSKIFLLSSADHGKTWNYVNDLINYKRAKKIDKSYLSITASSLVVENSRAFLLGSPIAMVGKRGIYLGTIVFEFDDISKGNLKKDSNGNIKVIKFIKRGLEGEFNAGQSDYDEHNINGGFIMPQVDPSSYPDDVVGFYKVRERILD